MQTALVNSLSIRKNPGLITGSQRSVTERNMNRKMLEQFDLSDIREYFCTFN